MSAHVPIRFDIGFKPFQGRLKRLKLWPERTICLHPFEATAKTVEIFYDTQNNKYIVY